ncbi:FAD-dependent oxidoreductase [Paracoccus sp. S-4012]|uniref:D-amino acid dehydrogenase n=1 Tax=Paracoccus sp. S-4012 TaxID=2665648 RepID=UPI0012B0533B|nr:D-amino acid dehydrogenase [Paracoccus sp. S-4012]MRX50458.1 FAD-dependent oxidoreductase [Paracoccus sp. S-4012]
MKIVVLGGGVIGVTSAWYLSQAGHEVTVIDREAEPARATSYANAGQISFGYCSPWAAPGIPVKAAKWMLSEHSPFILRPKAEVEMVSWLTQMLGNCTSSAYARNKGRMLRIADYSRRSLAELRDSTGIEYDGARKGTLQLFRTEAQVEAADKDMKALAADGVPFELLDADGCIAVEPGLAHARHLIKGGLRTPNDETGDCYKFTTRLAALAAARGVTFRHGVTIRHLIGEFDRVTGVETDAGRFDADALVVALGSQSPGLVREFGIRLPVYPVKGYSLTIPILDPARAPVSTVMDESFKIALTRLGDRIRVGGMAEIAGFDDRLDARRRRTLELSVTDLFPGGDLKAASFWTGLRPMTPDGTPVIGATGVRGLWLNTGHGTLGWTMSCGSARLLADQISGRKPEIDTEGLGVDRYGNVPAVELPAAA